MTFDVQDFCDRVESVCGRGVGVHDAVVTDEDRAAVNIALGRGPLIGGPVVEEFEREVARVSGRPFAVATSSGTMALRAALVAAGLRSGTPVWVDDITFAATAHAIEEAGGRVDAVPFGCCPSKSTWYVPTHLMGALPGNHAAVSSERTVADACQAFGVPLRSGIAAAISFNASKVVTGGGGGAVVTDDEGLAARVRRFIDQGKEPHPWDFRHARGGTNGRMPAMCAALALSQIRRLPDILERKVRIWRKYHDTIAGVWPPAYGWNHWLVPCEVPAEAKEPILDELHSRGIGARSIFRPLTMQPLWSGTTSPGNRNLYETTICLPSGLGIAGGP